MKDKSKNSRIKFSYHEVEVISNCLSSWIKVDVEEFSGKDVNQVQFIVDMLNTKKSIKKGFYVLDLNYIQLLFIYNIIAEDFLQIGNIFKEDCLSIISNVKNVIQKNYKFNHYDLLYSVQMIENKSI